MDYSRTIYSINYTKKAQDLIIMDILNKYDELFLMSGIDKLTVFNNLSDSLTQPTAEKYDEIKNKIKKQYTL